jgi:DNA-binding NtrC family response regulator
VKGPVNSILVVSGNQEYRDALVERCSSCKLRPKCCSTAGGAAKLLGQESFSIIFCDDQLPDGSFETVLKCAARCGTRTPVIVTSRRDDWELFLKALNVGAFDYIALPPLPGEVERIVRAALADGGVPTAATETSQASA